MYDKLGIDSEDKIVDIYYRKKKKNPSLIVFLLSGDIQLIEFKDNYLKCLSQNYY